MKEKSIAFIKKEIVLIISLAAALITTIFIGQPSSYLEFIDFRTLGILFALMLVVVALRNMGFFLAIGEKMVSRANSERALALFLFVIVFVLSMFITNDVALITFVPFSIELLAMLGSRKNMIFIIVMETIAANLGSMLTPFGNPQNLYIYSASQMTAVDFILTMLPYTLFSLVLIAVSALFIKGRRIKGGEIRADFKPVTEGANIEQKKSLKEISARPVFYLFIALFVIAILAVFKLIPWYVMVIIVAGMMLVLDRSAFKRVDYSLLFTFVFLFIFVGNMQGLPAFANALEGVMEQNELATTIIASQVISNVPATVLLSGFTSNYTLLLLGANIGGLGTIIASMASLISYKYYVHEHDAKAGKYLGVFTIVNIIFLAALIGLKLLLGAFAI